MPLTSGYTDPSPYKERYFGLIGVDNTVSPPMPMAGMLTWTGTAWEKAASDGAGSLTTNIQGYNGTNYHPARIDTSTRSFQTIDYPHHEIHAGNYFNLSHYGTGKNDGDTINVYIKTPNTTKYVHMFCEWTSSGAAFFFIREAPTVTANTGTAETAYNRNRNSATTSTVWNNAATPAQGSGSTDVTITVNGTTLLEEYVGTARQVWGQGRSEQEWVLDANTVYCFVVESDAAGLVLSLSLKFYEHTDQAA